MSTTQVITQLKKEDIPKVAYLFPTNNTGVCGIEVHDYLSIGRATSNNLEIADPFVSTYHARIERREKGYMIRDLRSRNGVFVNGVKVSEAYLFPGDRIKLGEREYAFDFRVHSKTKARIPASKSDQWNKNLKAIPNYSQTDLPVLLLGESGVGKEVIARTVHENSARQNGPFVSVNCSALSESLVESELFGHSKGSFTGATHDRKGAFESARGGTLFLDEIGDLPLSLQPKLLRALENKEIRPVGSDKNIPTNTRIIAATHRNVVHLIESGKFRADLYFRLNVIKVEIPALRERMEDFEDLLMGFAREMRVRFSVSAIREMKNYKWPGNVRELKNAVARASALSSNNAIEREDLHMIMDPVQLSSVEVYEIPPSGESLSLIKQLERKTIIEKLIQNSGNQRKTALALGMPKSTLHDRVKHYGINIKELLGKI